MTIKKSGWLLFFYSVPSNPVSNRMKIWRRLSKAGAVQLKGAVYILPYSEEHYELCQWLVSEVTAMQGEGTFVVVEKVETITGSDIVDLFNRQRESDYHAVEKGVEELERKIQGIKKGSASLKDKKLFEEFSKHIKEFEDIRRIDFFSSKAGESLRKKIRDLEIEIKKLTGGDIKEQPSEIARKNIEDYRGKVWVTRKKPFIDRMASAWLIKKYIDANAVFNFMDENETDNPDKDMIAFDVRTGEFTHVGDMCTFEVLVKSFGFKERTLKKIAEIVHDLDLKDDKYSSAEAKGLEEILNGIRKTAKDDKDALEKGMSVFEMLYVSKTS